MANFHNQPPQQGVPFGSPLPFPGYHFVTQTQTKPASDTHGVPSNGQTVPPFHYPGSSHTGFVPPIPDATGASSPQFQAFWTHFQSGAFPPLLGPDGHPLPPPMLPPGLNVSAAPPFNGLPQNQASPPQPDHSQSEPKSRIMEVQEADKEEGEVSDGDSTIYVPQLIDAHPRSAPQTTNHEPTSRQNSSSGRTRAVAASRALTRNTDASQGQHAHGRASATTTVVEPSRQDLTIDSGKQVNKEKAKRFLIDLSRHNYGLVDLTREGLDRAILVEHWRDAGLPLPASTSLTDPKISGSLYQFGHATSSTSKNNVSPDVPLTQTSSSSPKDPKFGLAETDRDPIYGSTGQPAASKAPAPVEGNRSAYIARLMAARSGKASTSVKLGKSDGTPTLSAESSPVEKKDGISTVTTKPQGGEIDMAAKSTQNVELSAPAADPSDSSSSLTEAERKKKQQNELIRKKMAMLQAAKAAKSTPVPSSTPINVETKEDVVPDIDESPQRSESPLYGDEIETAEQLINKALSSPRQRGGFLYPGQNTVSGVEHIPGLVSVDEKTAAGGNRRKRPVASDFDSMPSAQSLNQKRPFGQPRRSHDDDPMIIEVSDDETAASSMDMEDDEDDFAVYGLAQTRPTRSFRDMPALTSFPSKAVQNTSTPSHASSGVNTPPVIVSSGVHQGKRYVDLTEHEKEIENLRRRIAEAEYRKKAKKTVPSQDPEQSAEPLHHNLKVRLTSNPAVQEIGRPTSTIVSAHPNDPEWKRRRRIEIQSGLELQQSSVARNVARLDELKREMERLEAENQRQLEEKEKLAIELESLGIDTDGMPLEVLQATKDEIDQRTNGPHVDDIKSNPIEAAAMSRIADRDGTPSENESDADDDDDIYHDDEEAPVEPTEDSNVANNGIDAMSISSDEDDNVESLNEANSNELDAQNIHSHPKSGSNEVKGAPQHDNEPYDVEDEHQGDADVPEDLVQDDTMIVIESEEDSEVEQEDDGNNLEYDDYQPTPIPPESTNVKDDAADLASSQDSIKDNSEDDFYSPDPTLGLTEQNQRDEDAVEDESDDYLKELSPASEEDRLDDNDPMAISVDSDSEAEDTHDVYPPTTAEDGDSEQEEGEYEPADIEIPDPLEEEYEPSGEYPAQSPSASSMSSSSSSDGDDDSLVGVEDTNMEIANNLAPGENFDQDASTETHTVDGNIAPVHAEAPSAIKYYKPYESPLRLFKAYRYHPHFSREVNGGVRSLTYSHNIDPGLAICPFEASGGACNDRDCVFQHFKNMGLTDNLILLQLGTTNPGRTDEEQSAWKEGLKGVLKDLKQSKTNDLNMIVNAIANYRREFLGDPNKILNLG